MELFGRELTIEQVIGFVRCNATPDEDLIHRAALELVAELEASQRRVDELFSNNQECSAVLENALIELGKSQRRERAVVKDLKRHRKHKCDACRFFGAVTAYSPCRDCKSPISNFGDGWEWRGPRDAGEDDQ